VAKRDLANFQVIKDYAWDIQKVDCGTICGDKGPVLEEIKTLNVKRFGKKC
jgi:hypothetical protein